MAAAVRSVSWHAAGMPAPSARATAAAAAAGDPASLPPITLIVGEEELLAERAIAAIVAAAGVVPGAGVRQVLELRRLQECRGMAVPTSMTSAPQT